MNNLKPPLSTILFLIYPFFSPILHPRYLSVLPWKLNYHHQSRANVCLNTSLNWIPSQHGYQFVKLWLQKVTSRDETWRMLRTREDIYIYIYEIADSRNSRVKKIQTLDYNTINKNNIINKTLDAATYHIELNDNNG